MLKKNIGNQTSNNNFSTPWYGLISSINHGVVFITLISKYLFNKNEIAYTTPVNRNIDIVPNTVYHQSFDDKLLIFNAWIISLNSLFPSFFTITTEKIKSGINRKYPVINQYSEGFSTKLDSIKGNRVYKRIKKYPVAITKIADAFIVVISRLLFLDSIIYNGLGAFHLTAVCASVPEYPGCAAHKYLGGLTALMGC